jgi:acetamidase/formamidase
VPVLAAVVLTIATTFALTIPSSARAQGSATSRLAGEWVFQMDGDNQPQRVLLTADRDSVRGQVYGQNFSGTVLGSTLTFRVGDFSWRGVVTGDSISGWLGIAPDSSSWKARRFRAPATARAFTFEPSTFHRAIGSTIMPALRLYPGDTVRTTTLDAGGWGRGAYGDRTNKRSIGGNPLTGPFYIEGAVPGDVLVVTLHRVRLNRGWAFSGTSLMDNTLEVGYAAARKSQNLDNKWTLDTIAGTARLTTAPAALKDFSVPLRPFLGVVAVAPGGEGVPSSRDSGPWGGNMEYAQLREGTTIYLPVNTLGAYLYVGDGHAAQGDGELTGDAMETSMDVTFSVSVKRWGFADIPRAENTEFIMSLGTGGSVDEALRHATTDLARWLEKEYALSASEAALVMGFAVIYDVPDLVPPFFGVSARLPKSALRGLRRVPPS